MLPRELSISAIGMNARDEMLVKSCLNLLGSHVSGVNWRFTENPDCDVAVCDPESPLAKLVRSRENAAGKPLCVALLNKAGHADDWPCVLRRPIRIGDFRALLERAAGDEKHFACVAAPAADAGRESPVLGALCAIQHDGRARTVALRAGGLELIIDTRQGRCQCAEGFGEAVLQSLAAHDAAVQVVDATLTVDAGDDTSIWLESLLWQLGERAGMSAFPELNEQRELRLMRWPDFGKVPPLSRHIQLSALLDQQARSMAGLVAVTGLPVADVQAFLRASSAIGVLDGQAVALPASPAPVAMKVAVTAPARRGGLFSMLRAALGMRG